MGTAAVGNGWEGRVVEGRFPLLERLGGSGNSVSFLTVLQGLQEAVIQLISTDAAESDSYVSQWEFARTLSHPHLAKIFAAGRCVIDQSDLVYVATERPSTTLSKMIQTKALAADSARETFGPVLDALLYLHQNGVVHGYINPSNIQFADLKPKLSVTDLLVAGSARRSLSLRGNYDAPELAQGIASAASDAWSVGMTLCEAMTQSLPTWDSSRNEEPEITESLPGPFREMVQECLRMDPLRRCSIETIVERLDESNADPISNEPISVQTGSAIVATPPIQTKEIRKLEKPEALPFPEETIETEAASEPVLTKKGIQKPEKPDALPFPEEKIETEVAAEPVLFSKPLTHFGEPGGGPLRIVGYAFVLLAVLSLVSFLLVRAGRIKVPAGMTSRNAPPVSTPAIPAVSTPAPERQSTVPVLSAPASPAPTPAAPASSASAPPVSDGMEGVSSPPAPQKKPEEAPLMATHSAPTQEQPVPPAPSAANHAKLRGRTEGLVEKRVMPNVAPGALAGMRRPVEVSIRVSVNRDGTVSDATYMSLGPGNYFARQAERAALSWKFTPPTWNGDAERSVWVLRFNFERGKTEATATIETK
jgi:serine/threonine protein kinase